MKYRRKILNKNNLLRIICIIIILLLCKRAIYNINTIESKLRKSHNTNSNTLVWLFYTLEKLK